jgi:hypothetical protein
MSTKQGIVTELEDDGWCASCDRVTSVAVLDDNNRHCCVVCGDFLIFAADEDQEDSEALYVKTWGLP